MANLHALLIDDDAQNLHIMEQLLKQLNITTTTLTDPTTLVEILQDLEKVDIVFLDLEMPRLDGYETLEILRQHLLPEIPIVACSVYTNEVHRTKKAGFNSFIAKPLDLDRFALQIERILSGNTVWETR